MSTLILPDASSAVDAASEPENSELFIFGDGTTVAVRMSGKKDILRHKAGC